MRNNKTRKLNDRVSYRIGEKFFYVIVDGKRHNFTVEELRGDRPVVSESAEKLYYYSVHHEDKDWFWFGDYGPKVKKECYLLYDWEFLGPKAVKKFCYSKGLIG